MVEKVKIEPKIITIHKGRPSFFKATEATWRTDKFGKPDKGPDGKKKPQYRMTWLLDPSDAQAATTIKEIKEEAARQLDLFFRGRENWPKDNAITGTKGIIKCFGNGNDLPKIYEGYKDMFFIKVSDTSPPIIGDRRGREIRLLDDNAWHVVDKATGKTTEETVDAGSAPYGGCFARGRISLYVYNNEQAGVNSNFSSCQFLAPGDSFGGGLKRRSVDDEFVAHGDAPASSGPSPDQDDDDPFK